MGWQRMNHKELFNLHLQQTIITNCTQMQHTLSQQIIVTTVCPWAEAQLEHSPPALTVPLMHTSVDALPRSSIF